MHRIRDALQCRHSYPYAAYLFVEDIKQYIAKNGNAVLDDTSSYLVFHQESDENAAFWSSFFGSRKMDERSFSYTKKKSWNPFANMMDAGGVISNPRKNSSVTMSVQKVEQPIYRPEVFKELRSNEAMGYLREPLLQKKIRIGDL